MLVSDWVHVREIVVIPGVNRPPDIRGIGPDRLPLRDGADISAATPISAFQGRNHGDRTHLLDYQARRDRAQSDGRDQRADREGRTSDRRPEAHSHDPRAGRDLLCRSQGASVFRRVGGFHDFRPGCRAGSRRRKRRPQAPRRHGRNRSFQGRGWNDPQAARQIDRRKLGAWFRCPRDGGHRNRPVFLGQRNRRLIWTAAARREDCVVNWVLHILDPATIGALTAEFQSEMQQPAFWVAVGKIVWINVLLSGDNALVIALACRGLAPRQRFWGMILGAGVAVILRIIFTGIVATLMELPYLKLVGGLALVVIAAKLLVPEEEDEDGVESASHLWAAVQIVVVADIVMSLDNVIAVAAAANGSVPLLILGLVISIPLIVAGAALIMALLNRLPILVWAGAALLGWIAGDVIATDPAIHPMLQALFAGPIGVKLDGLLAMFGTAPRFANGGNGGELVCAVLGVIVVLVVGSIWRKRKLRQVEHTAASAGEAAQPIDRL